MVKELRARWERFPPDCKNSPFPDNGSDVAVSLEVHEHLLTMVTKSVSMGDGPKVGQRLAVALYRALDRPADSYIPRWIINAFDAEYDFFVRRAHLSSSVAKPPTGDGLAEHFDAFERAFHSLIGPYFSGKEELDAILQDTNETAD
jgi:hypothetical protein